MSFDDFCKCTFEEFESICRAWREMSDNQERGQWERARTVATIIIQPHIKKHLTPRELLPLPWDHQPAQPAEAPQLTPEERRKRFEELAKLV